MNRNLGVYVEGLLVVAAVGLALWGADTALDRALEQASLRSGEAVRTLEEVQDARGWALIAFAVGSFALFGGGVLGRLRSGGSSIAVPLLLPATILAAGMGFAVQLGYGDPLRGPGWPGPSFAGGVLIGGILGGAILAAPWDWEGVADRGRHLLLGGVLIAFAGLTVFGTGPAGTRINLLGFQPLELVKLAFVAYVAVFLGRRAAALRYQRNYLLNGLLRVPRPRLLLPATLVLVSLFVGLFLVRDLGPILILGLTFLMLFTVVTRSAPWALLALGLVVLAVAVIAASPEMVGSSALALRMHMWLDPWTNALPNGDQLAASRWAIAAGGLTGQGVGHAFVGALPAGQTDLVLAHLAEELGFLGVAVYQLLLAAIIGSGVWVAMENRTPERVLLAGGLSALLASQWLVIFGGTTGLLPLTGVVVPFLSAGRTSMVAFLAAVALLGALARNGQARAHTDELDQLRGGMLGVGASLGALMVMAIGVLFAQGVLGGLATSARGVVTTLGDGTIVHRHDRRIEAIAGRVPRGEIRDRGGAVLAGNAPDGTRRYPLGSAMGTLLGPATSVVLRPAWALERVHDPTLRGWPDRPDGPSAWLARGDDGKERLLFVSQTRKRRPRDLDRAEAQAAGDVVRQLPLPAPDYRSVVPVLRVAPEDRAARIERQLGTVGDRSITLTVDGALQQRAAAVLAAVAKRGEAAAAVVIDVDSGEVLARVQVPDIDPADHDAWLPEVQAQDPAFVGVYGPWSDLTGYRGVLQAGSIGKLVTAVAAVRDGVDVHGSGCAVRTVTRWSCTQRNARGPFYTRDGWKSPVHDYYRDQPHGRIDLAEALAVSCNVTFAQVALELGPEPYRALVADGLDLGWSNAFDAGGVGTRTLAETGFGQGATALSVSQAARLVAMIGAGGTYRRCDLVRGSPCEEIRLVEDPTALNVVLAGMHGAMVRGTGRSQRRIDGVRVYGKTGTADSIGLRDEEPYGMIFGREGYRPHSWFVAVAEPDVAPECRSAAPGRLAIAVVVARGGTGAAVAAPAALDILREARQLGYLGGAS